MEEALKPGDVGRRLIAARYLRGHTNRDEFAAEVSRRYDMPTSAIRAIEEGRRGLKAMEATALADYLALPTEWFTAPLEELLSIAPPRAGDQLDRIESTLALLVDRLVEGEEPLPLTEPDEVAPEGSSGSAVRDDATARPPAGAEGGVP